MARLRVPAVWSVMLLLAAACSGGSDGEQEREQGDSFREIASPIVDIVPAASIGEDGRPVDPALVFAPDAQSITVVAQVGEVTGSPMDITWSQVTVDGEEELFTHTLDVGSFDAAYSVGENRGTLAPGTYRVEATLEGESLSTRFEVEGSEDTGAEGQGATSGPPTSGDSGTVGPPIDEPGQSPAQTSLDTFLNLGPVDPSAATITLDIIAGVLGGAGRVEAKATMGGSTRTLSFPTDASGVVVRILTFDPCAHPGGSDLPGARAEFETALYEGDALFQTNVDLTTLGPDQTAPVLEVTSDPPPGSKVEPGDIIVVSIVARELREGGTWQTGVKQIRLLDFDTGAIIGDQVFGDEALPCESKAWSKGLDVPYEVPDDPPPVIRLLAEGFDIAGNASPHGLSYPTTEVWEGTYTGTVTGECPDPREWSLEGEFTITVADEVATMDITHTVTGSCGGPNVGTFTTRITATGEKTPTGFEFASFGDLFGGSGSLTFTVSDDRGSGTILITDLAPGLASVELAAEITRV